MLKSRRSRWLLALAPAVALVALALWLPGSGGERPVVGQGAPRAPAGLPGCAAYGWPQVTGRTPPVLDELSGLAASARHPGVYWAHNDSGNAGELVAVTAAGEVRARFALVGWDAKDLEDVAVGPCAPGEAPGCVYLADTGNNLRLRGEVAVLQLREPATLAGGAVQVEPLRFRYADGRHDAEALLVHPRTAELAVVTKEPRAPGAAYLLEGLGPGRVGTARLLRRLPGPGAWTTGASVHPSGERALLRSYAAVHELRAPGARDLAALLGAERVEVPSQKQRQGEAVAYGPDGRGYLLGSEFTGEPLMWVPCDAASR